MGTHFRRKLLMIMISAALFVTIGLHVAISMRQISGESENRQKVLSRETREVDGNIMNKARQLASYETSNIYETVRNKNNPASIAAANNMKDGIPNGKQLSNKLVVPRPIMQDIKGSYIDEQISDEDGEIGFWGCGNRGTFDVSGYPLVDARNIYCGSSMIDGDIRAPAAIKELVLKRYLEKSKTIPNGRLLPNITIQDVPLAKIEGVNIGATSQFPTCKRFAVYSKGRVKVQENRTVDMGSGKKYNSGPLVFFPPLLSKQWVLMKFLRTLYKECAVSSRLIAATVKFASVQSKSVNVPFCVYLNVVGGGIKESYVLWEGNCGIRSLPTTVAKCSVNDASV